MGRCNKRGFVLLLHLLLFFFFLFLLTFFFFFFFSCSFPDVRLSHASSVPLPAEEVPWAPFPSFIRANVMSQNPSLDLPPPLPPFPPPPSTNPSLHPSLHLLPLVSSSDQRRHLGITRQKGLCVKVSEIWLSHLLSRPHARARGERTCVVGSPCSSFTPRGLMWEDDTADTLGEFPSASTLPLESTWSNRWISDSSDCR